MCHFSKILKTTMKHSIGLDNEQEAIMLIFIVEDLETIGTLPGSPKSHTKSGKYLEPNTT